MRAELSRDLGPVLWSDLRAHAARDAVIVIEPSLDLLDAACAVAADDQARVAAWIGEGKVRKPTAAELGAWTQATDARWDAVVVQPFVLVRVREQALAADALAAPGEGAQ